MDNWHRVFQQLDYIVRRTYLPSGFVSFTTRKLQTISENHLAVFLLQQLSQSLEDFLALWTVAHGKWIMNMNPHLSTLRSKMLLLGYSSLFASLITSSPFWNSLSAILSLITFKFKLLVFFYKTLTKSYSAFASALVFCCFCFPGIFLWVPVFPVHASFLFWHVICSTCVFLRLSNAALYPWIRIWCLFPAWDLGHLFNSDFNIISLFLKWQLLTKMLIRSAGD